MRRKNKTGLFAGIIFCLFAFPGHANREEVVFPKTFKDCTSSDQCMLLEKDCGNCCDYDAINRTMRDGALDFKHKSCAGYQGGVCSCAAAPMEARCVAGSCKVVLLDIPKEQRKEWYEKHGQ